MSEQQQLFDREGSRIKRLVGRKRSRPEDFRAKVRAVLAFYSPRPTAQDERREDERR